MTRPINGERALPTDVVKPHEHQRTDEERRRVIQQRNMLAAKIRDVWNEDTLARVERALEDR